ncbi:MAG: hypothetical protein R2735_08810 [Microthrixaceae bacterium]
MDRLTLRCPPSEVFKDHFLACFIEDSAGLRMLDLIGEDIVCVGVSYPTFRLHLAQ